MCLLTNCQEGKLADFAFMTIIFCILSSGERCGSERDEHSEEQGLLGRIYGDRACIFLTESECERWYESEVKCLPSASK